MRKIERIPEVLDIIGNYWTKNPDMRLMQLLLNVRLEKEDLYYLEDYELVNKLHLTYGDKP
jgi:uncharacterized protein YihD (DUF1040 family)